MTSCDFNLFQMDEKGSHSLLLKTIDVSELQEGPPAKRMKMYVLNDHDIRLVTDDEPVINDACDNQSTFRDKRDDSVPTNHDPDDMLEMSVWQEMGLSPAEMGSITDITDTNTCTDMGSSIDVTEDTNRGTEGCKETEPGSSADKTDIDNQEHIEMGSEADTSDNTKTGNENDDKTDDTVTSHKGAVTEVDIGITEYVSSHKGFMGVIKQRYIILNGRFRLMVPCVPRTVNFRLLSMPSS